MITYQQQYNNGGVMYLQPKGLNVLTTDSTLSANLKFVLQTPPYTAHNNTTIIVQSMANVTMGSYTVDLFGTMLTQEIMDSPFFALCTYSAITGAWNVYVAPNINSLDIEEGMIKDDAIGVDKLKSSEWTRGDVLRGDSSGDPEIYNIGSGGQILLVDANGDPTWTSMSGDATITNDGVVTVSGVSGGLQTATLSLTSAQILALNTTPQTVIPAQGAGKIITPIMAYSQLTFGTAAYATNTRLQLNFATATDSCLIEQNTLGLTSTGRQHFTYNIPSGVTVDQYPINEALLLDVQTGNPVTGDGTIKVYVTYTVTTV